MAESRSSRRDLLYAILVVGGFFCALEAAARLVEQWRPPASVDYGLGFDERSRVFIEDSAHPGMMVTAPEKRIAFLEQRFRREKPRDMYRLAVIGESSVRHLQGELQGLAAHLAHGRPFEVINGGGFSYGSHRLVLVTKEVLGFEPDLVILYLGHNEFEELEQLQLADLDRQALARWLSRSAMVRTMRDLWAAGERRELERSHNRRILEQSEVPFARAWVHDFTPEEVQARMVEFERNLRRMVELCRESRVPVVLSTIPSNLLRPYLAEAEARRYTEVWKSFERGAYREGLDLGRRILSEARGRHQSSSAENEILRRVAQELGVPLVDVESAVERAEPHGVPGETLFQDHCHLNGEGNVVWRRAFEAALP